MSDALGFLPDTKPDVAEPWRSALLQAADYIDKHGWLQGRYGEVGGPRCISGAVMATAGHDAWAQTLSFWEQRFGCAPCVWNDAPGRTAAEVTAALRACARQ